MIQKFDIRRELFTSSVWSSVGSISYSIRKFITFLFVARHLEPDQFGLIALVLAFTSFLPMILRSSFQLSIVEKREQSEDLINTVFTIYLIVGITSILFFWSVSEILGLLFNVSFSDLLVLASLTSSLALLDSVSHSVLQSRLNFRAIALQRLLLA